MMNVETETEHVETAPEPAVAEAELAGSSLILSGFSVSAGTSRLVRLQSWGSPEGGKIRDLGISCRLLSQGWLEMVR